uniref:Protein kinase domain-containing protein n=1 Tax=Romanomermis culicivorax TaxID=13658 RepID=A0A915IXU6_ROMCU
MNNRHALLGDIKPENYVIGRSGAEKRTIYLLDFGMVRRYRAKVVFETKCFMVSKRSASEKPKTPKIFMKFQSSDRLKSIYKKSGKRYSETSIFSIFVWVTSRTVGYASPRVLSNMDASRCDDLCSWFYIVTEFMCGDLPWHVKDVPRRKMAMVKKMMIKQLLATIPDQMRTIYDKIMALDYYDVPPYDSIKAYLNEKIGADVIK